jgi:hypothetical protein
MDEIIVSRFNGDVELQNEFCSLSPEIAKIGVPYPWVTYSIEEDVAEACASGDKYSQFNLDFLVETKTKEQGIRIRKRIRTIFDNWNAVKFTGYSDSWEKTTKSYVQMVTFKILKTW